MAVGAEKMPAQPQFDSFSCTGCGAVSVPRKKRLSPDVAAARNAGIKVVAVSYGYSKKPAAELGADAVLADFDELPALLANLP